MLHLLSPRKSLIHRNNHFPSHTVSEHTEETPTLFFQIRPKAKERAFYSDFGQFHYLLSLATEFPGHDVSLASNERTRTVFHHMHCRLLRSQMILPWPIALHFQHHSHSYKRTPFHCWYSVSENVPLVVSLGWTSCGKSMYPDKRGHWSTSQFFSS